MGRRVLLGVCKIDKSSISCADMHWSLDCKSMRQGAAHEGGDGQLFGMSAWHVVVPAPKFSTTERSLYPNPLSPPSVTPGSTSFSASKHLNNTNTN